MKKLVAAIACLALVACGEDPVVEQELALDTPDQVMTYLEGKTWVMQGDAIPSHPNGFNENVNYGAVSQCFAKVTITTQGGDFAVSSDLATIVGATDVGTSGDCDRVWNEQSPFTAASTSLLVENVAPKATCFDITANYGSYQQEGRAKFSADGKTLTMELFFKDQATGHRCANGAVGASGVTLNVGGNPSAFTGNAQQVYTLQQ